MANSSSLFQVLDSFSRKNDVAAFTQDLTTAIKDGDKLAAMKALTDLANIFSGIAEATALSNQELARLGIDGNSTWVKIGNNYINPSAKFASVSLNIIEIVNDMAQNQPVKLGPVLGLIDDGTDALSSVSLRVGYVPLALGLKAVSITAGGLSVLFGESNLFQTHIPTVQQNLAAGKSPSGGVFGQVTDMGGKYAIYATKNADGTMNELLIPMQGSTITDNRLASGSPTKYTYTTNGIPNQIEYEGSVVSFNPITGALIGSARTYSDSSYELLTGILSTTDFLSSSVDSDSNVFSTNASKDKFGTIAGIRQAVGALSANERWGGQTFATASTNLGSYLGNLNYVDPSTLYQNTLVNSFSFNTNFGSYIPPVTYQPGGNGSVYIGPPITIWIGNPVVLDLNQNGVELISLDESRALFDMSGTGFRQRTAWVAPSDALLAIDYNDDGVIKERKEINFVDWTNNPNLTDMEALALAFDTNKDGRLDSADADFSKFRVWQDKNADGVSDAGELLTLTQAGIKSIDLKTTKMNWSRGANSISGLGSYTKLDGSQGLLSDSAFGHESAGWKAETVNGIQRVINERGDKYAVAGPTGNFVVNLNTEGLNGAIGGAGSDSMTTSGATPVFMQGNAGNDSLVCGDGDDWLEGGSGSDSISGGSGDDTIIVDSEDNLANISGGAGFDIIAFEGSGNFNIKLNLANGFESAIGGEGNDNISVQSTIRIPQYWLQGGTYPVYIEEWTDLPVFVNSIISGGAGNDTITGGVGNDIIEGGSGNDVLNGDWGNDTYLFGFGDGKDSINDKLSTTWNYGSQAILKGGAFPTFYNGSHGIGVEEENIWGYYTGNNSALYNQSRNSDVIKMTKGVLAADVVMEKPYSIPTAPNYDLFIGLRQDKSFNSVTQLDDYLTLKNWQFTRSYVLYYQKVRDQYGNETNQPVYGYYQPNKVESIEFSDGSKLLIDNWFQGTLGASKSDQLTGNASDNLLNGLAGADIMSGGLGNDIYVVDNINDVVTESAGQGNDSVQTFVTLNGELWANVENLTLVGSNNINGMGNSLSNIIKGNVGNNILNGGAGNDTMSGGGGSDTLRGGLGNDVYIVDSSFDLIQELDGEGLDKVESSVTYTLSEHVENLLLTGSANINGTGNSLDNMIIGNAGSNILNGILGSDTLVGGAGNDTYIVAQPEYNGLGAYEAGIDLIIDNDSTIGNTDTIEVGFENILSQEAYNGSDGAYTLFLDVRRQLTNDGHDNLKLTARSNYISDSPYSSSEVFGGFLIQDQFKPSSKVEQIKFVTGEVETLDNYLNRVGYIFFGSDNNDIMKSDNAIGARDFNAGLGNDYLLGNSSIDRFNGNQGHDILQGLSGGDYLNGYEDNDLIDGGAGVDRLSGDIGNDILIGGKDADIISVGTGYDVLLFNKGDGADTVNASVGTDNTLSLGGNFAYSDLSLSKSASDLILKMGGADQITFKGWYNGTVNNKSLSNLQIVLDDSRISSTITSRNDKVEIFNFADVVAAFDAAGSINNWQLSDTLLSAHIKSGSNNVAIGGDIAYQYGKFGNLTGIGLNATQAVLSNANFGQAAQTFSTGLIGSNEAIKLS